MGDMGRLLIILGVVIVVVGVVLSMTGRIPFLGKLPGDFMIRREGFTFYFPLATSILLSILLSLLLRLINK